MSAPEPVTLQTIADALGISRSTVSLALRDAPQIAGATRERIRRSAIELGYVANRNAVRLRTQVRNLMGLVVPDITNPVVAEAALGLQGSIDRRGLIVTLSNTFDDVDVQSRVLRELVAEQVAAIVLIPALGTTPADIDEHRLGGVPLMLLNRPIRGSAASTVAADDRAVVRLALEHLFHRHDTRVAAYFGGIGEALPRQERWEAFQEECGELGVAVAQEWSGPTLSSALDAAEATRRLLRSGAELPSGIVTHNDVVALGVTRAFHEFGITPDRCPLVSIDDIQQATVAVPALTTVALHLRELGELAGERMLAAINGETSDLPSPQPTLIIRESCGCG